MELKKYLLYKLSSAQAEVATLQDLIANISPATKEAADLAPAPANKSSVKKTVTKKVEAEETEDEGLALDAEESEDALDPESDESNGISEQDVVKAIQGLAVKMGKPYVAALLKKFKAKSIQELKEKDYEQVLATIESTLKAKKK